MIGSGFVSADCLLTHLWMQPPHKADLSNPELTIVVSVVKNSCAIGTATQFKELCKYNLRELCNEPEEKQKAAPVSGAAAGETTAAGEDAKSVKEADAKAVADGEPDAKKVPAEDKKEQSKPNVTEKAAAD